MKPIVLLKLRPHLLQVDDDYNQFVVQTEYQAVLLDGTILLLCVDITNGRRISIPHELCHKIMEQNN